MRKAVKKMRVVTKYLVVKANGEVRVTRRRPTLGLDEVAYPLVITIPDGWGQVLHSEIQVTLPAPIEVGFDPGSIILPCPPAPTAPLTFGGPFTGVVDAREWFL